MSLIMFRKYVAFLFLIFLPIKSYANEGSALHFSSGVGLGSTSKNGFKDSTLLSATVGYQFQFYKFVVEAGYQNFESFDVKSIDDSRIEIEAFTVALSKRLNLRPSFSLSPMIGLMRYETRSILLGSNVGTDSDVTEFLGLTGTIHVRAFNFSLNYEFINDIGGTDISAIRFIFGYSLNL